MEANVIKKVRRKFTVIAMCGMFVCMMLLIATINVANYVQTDKKLSLVISELVQKKMEKDRMDTPRNDLPKMPIGRHSANVQYGNRFFWASHRQDGGWDVFVKDADAITESEAKNLAQQVEDKQKESGYLDDYKYLVFQTEKGTGIYFLDCSTDLAAFRSLRVTSIVIGLIGFCCFSFFVFYMSGKAMNPLKESMEKQKRFITDAGHELKTPVAVIGTNMEILQMDMQGENEWIDSTKRQVTALRKLIAHLISLAKLEESQNEMARTLISMSDAVMDCVEVYETMAESEGKNLASEVKENLWIKAEENSLRQILTILFENAVKYSTEHSKIEIRLFKNGKKVIFQTKNEWKQDVKKEELQKMFERFFRGDQSRNRDGKNSGYGLGLSIAKAAVKKNKGEIRVYEDVDGRLTFEVTFAFSKQEQK